MPAISVILTDLNNRPLANLTGLTWAWWDEPVLNAQGAPVLSGTGASTDASGVFSVTELTGSTLTDGQVGWLEITDSDGTVTQAPVANVAAGPIAVVVVAGGGDLPLDLVPGAVVAYSVRALSSDFVGQDIYTLRDDEFVETWIDQSGNGSDAANTPLNQPALVADQVNGRPALEGVANSQLFTADEVTFPDGAATVFLLCKVFDTSVGMNMAFNTDNYVNFRAGTSLAVQDIYDDGTGNEAMAQYDSSSAVGEFVLWDGAWEFGNYSMALNGAEQTPTFIFESEGIPAITDQLQLFFGGTGNAVCELIAYPTVLSSEDRTAIRENIADYYGITLGPPPEMGGFTSGFDGGFS